MSFTLYDHGAAWCRADFHLHTNADQEFKVPGGVRDEEAYLDDYVQRLENANIEVGVITNHNKCDLTEFRKLRDLAATRGILLLAGVELSAKYNVHTLICFSPDWYDNDQKIDYINRFLNAAFEHVDDRENENTCCKFDVEQILDALWDYKAKGRDSFIVFAHVDQTKGLVKELGGGPIKTFLKNRPRKWEEFVVGFQKVRSKQGVTQWFREADFPLPAFLEGCDCKKPEAIGKAHQQGGKDKISFLKIGTPTFQAVKFGLINHEYRVSVDDCPNPNHSFLKKVSFVGGKMNGQTIQLNQNLNCLMGSSGSGKTSILEAIRFALGYSLDDVKTAKDKSYKQKVVQHLLGAGGKISIELVAQNGSLYTIERMVGGAPIVKNDENQVINARISDLIDFLYFGQRDLTFEKEGEFEDQFIREFFKRDLAANRAELQHQKEVVSRVVARLNQFTRTRSEREKAIGEKALLDERLRKYRQHDVHTKMEREKRFVEDKNYADQIAEVAPVKFTTILTTLEQVVEEVRGMTPTESMDNQEEIKGLEELTDSLINQLNRVDAELVRSFNDFEAKAAAFKKIIEQREEEFAEEFAVIRRDIDLGEDLSADMYTETQLNAELLAQRITTLDEELSEEAAVRSTLDAELTKLQSIHQSIHAFYQSRLDEINENEAIKVEFDQARTKKRFQNFLYEKVGRGTGLSTTRYGGIADHFTDVIEVYRDMVSDEPKLKDVLGESGYTKFKDKFLDRLADNLTFYVEPSFTLFYHDLPIAKHSHGQTASAIILFVLSIGSQDLIILDQPEDDLNSADIYEEIVQSLLGSKECKQFLFATHDSNITVLGDCEQVLCCAYADGKITIDSGSIDRVNTQKNVIRVMEGGPTAFTRRNRIYASWKKAATV